MSRKYEYDLKKAKSFIKDLYKKGWGFHFEDTAVDCLHNNGLCSLEEAQIIDRNLDQIYQSNLNWGEYKCPIGYLISLQRF